MKYFLDICNVLITRLNIKLVMVLFQRPILAFRKGLEDYQYMTFKLKDEISGANKKTKHVKYLSFFHWSMSEIEPRYGSGRSRIIFDLLRSLPSTFLNLLYPTPLMHVNATCFPCIKI